MEWVLWPHIQGIAALFGILQGVAFVLDIRNKSRTSPTLGDPLPESILQGQDKSAWSIAAYTLGVIFIFVFGWITYSVPWALLAFSMGFSTSMVFSVTFLVLGSLPPVGSLLVKSKIFGGFLGGGLPMGLLALFLSSSNPEMQQFGSPFAYFIVFTVFCGFIGALTGPLTVKSAQAFRLPLPFHS